jgi:hypothetical protein
MLGWDKGFCYKKMTGIFFNILLIRSYGERVGKMSFFDRINYLRSKHKMELCQFNYLQENPSKNRN